MTIQTKQTIKIFDNQLVFEISYKDWCYLCNNIFYTFEPNQDDIEAEFVTGTGITPKKKESWGGASTKFTEYINNLRTIKSLDINKMCRELLEKEE